MTMSSMSKLPAVLLVCSFLVASSVIVLSAKETPKDGLSRFLPAFQSEQELGAFIENSVSGHYWGNASYGSSGAEFRQILASKQPSHSETNIQVAGVDEADKVKTDGKYIYIASSDRVTVVDAYPVSDLSNVSCIHSDDFSNSMVPDAYVSVWGIFVTDQDLVIIWTWSERYTREDIIVYSGTYGPTTAVSVIDLSNIRNPTIEKSFGISGYPMAARMIGSVVYLVTQQSVWANEGVGLPQVWTGSNQRDMSVNRVHYDPETLDANSFVNVLTVDTGSEEMDSVSVLAGWSGTVYMSQTALYLTFPKYASNAVRIMTERPDTGHTTIYKLVADGPKVSAAARGEVDGFLNDQYSLDEKDGLLRVTTSNSWSSLACNVFVMNESLRVIGSIKGLAEGERVTASRFVGDTLYLVTFRSVDPLFVIDLRHPTEPSVLGELTIPGFSSYLQPIDNQHILGIGTETGSAKLSLFDVTNPFTPIEESKYIVEGSSWTDATSDPKAVLFDKKLELLVIPIHANYYDTDYVYKSESYAGVFKISVDSGIELRGKISHEQNQTLGYYNSQYGYYSYYDYDIDRALYISDCLYTVSQTIVQANNLSDLSSAGSLVYFDMNSDATPAPIPLLTNRSV